MRLSAERERELMNELRLRVLFTNKMICRRYGISLATLKRRQAAALERPLSQIGSETLHVVCFTSRSQQKTRAA